ELSAARVTWHDVVDGTAGMISNPMYARRADITPSPRKKRGRCYKVRKSSYVLWACLGTATMMICITAVMFAMLHHLQVRVEEAENRIVSLENILNHRGKSGPSGPPGPLGEPGVDGPPGSPSPLFNVTTDANSLLPEASSDGKVSEGSGDEQDEGHLDSEGPDDAADDVM
ncbi:hypothetical protein Bbelb_122200, partial [Branchiostoma belcheri]